MCSFFTYLSRKVLTRRRVSAYAAALAIVTWLPFILLNLRSIEINERPGVDFFITYTAAKLATTNPDKMYDLDAQQVIHRNLIPASLQGPQWQHNYPPFFSIMLLPLGNLPYAQAYWVWTGISILLYVVSIWVLISLFPSNRSHAVSVSMVAVPAPAFVWCIMSGQTTALSLFLWSLAFYLMKRGRLLCSGLVVGLLSYRFQFLIIIGPLLLAKRCIPFLLGLASSAFLLVLAGVLVFSFQSYIDYVETLKTLSTRISTGLHPLPKYISLYGFFRLVSPNTIAIILTFGFVCLLVYWLIRVSRGPILVGTPVFDLQIALLILVTLLAMHHSLVYDLLILTLPVLIIHEHRTLFPNYCKLLLALIYFAPYFSFIVAEKIEINPVQPLLLWLTYEIYRVVKEEKRSSILANPRDTIGAPLGLRAKGLRARFLYGKEISV